MSENILEELEAFLANHVGIDAARKLTEKGLNSTNNLNGQSKKSNFGRRKNKADDEGTECVEGSGGDVG